MYLKLFTVMVAALPMAVAADVRVVEEIACKVNGDVVTRGELLDKRRELEMALRQEQKLTGLQLAQAIEEQSKNLLKDEIDTLLLVQQAKDLNINVESEVNRYIGQLRVDSKIADTDKFQEYIRQQTGMPFEDFKQKLTNQFLTRQVINQEIGSRVNIPEADLQKYYDEHKNDFMREEQVFLSQVLISLDGKTAEQVTAAEAKAKDIVDRARKGEKFADLARSYSDDDTARGGGYVGSYKRGIMKKEIEDVVFKEKKGYITDPISIQSPHALLILKVEDHYQAGLASFDDVKEDIREKLATPLMDARMRPYLTKLREQAFLEIKEGYIDTGAAPGKDTRWHEVAQLKPQTVTKEEVAAAQKHRKHLLFIPIPGTTSKPKPAATSIPQPEPPPPTVKQ